MRANLRKALALEIGHNIDQAQVTLQRLLKAWQHEESTITNGRTDAAVLCRLLFQIQIEQWHIIQDQLRLLKLGS
jgi:hypothetical protein